MKMVGLVELEKNFNISIENNYYEDDNFLYSTNNKDVRFQLSKDTLFKQKSNPVKLDDNTYIYQDYIFNISQIINNSEDMIQQKIRTFYLNASRCNLLI